MKKFNLFLFALMMPILFMASCDSNPTVSNAAFRVQEVLEQKFSPNCKFDNGSIKGEEEYKDHFKVYQKFTAENKYGSAKNYIYKARLIYKGGDKYENSSWNIDYILVENINTGEQWNINTNDIGSNSDTDIEIAPKESTVVNEPVATFMVHGIIQKDFSIHSLFDKNSIVFEKEKNNEYLLSQKFNIYNNGKERHYLYKAILIHNGGAFDSAVNWKVKSVVVDDLDTGDKWDAIKGTYIN